MAVLPPRRDPPLRAPPAARPLTAATNIEIAQRAYAALSARDFDAFVEHVDPDVSFTSLIAEAEGEDFHGYAGVQRWWDEVLTALGGMDLVPIEFRDLGDAVLVHLEARGSAGGVAIAQTIWQAIKLRDRKAVWWAGFRSEAEALDALEARSR